MESVILAAFLLSATECDIDLHRIYGAMNDERQCMNTSGYDMAYDFAGDYIGWKNADGDVLINVCHYRLKNKGKCV